MRRRKSNKGEQISEDSCQSCLTQEDASNGMTKRVGDSEDDVDPSTSELYTCKKEDNCDEYDWTLPESPQTCRWDSIAEDDVKESTSEFQTCKKEEDNSDDYGEFTFADWKSSGALLNSPHQDVNAINTNPESSRSRQHAKICMKTAEDCREDTRSLPEFSDPIDEQEALFDEAFLLSRENDTEKCESHKVAGFSKDTGNSIGRKKLDKYDSCISMGKKRHHSHDKLMTKAGNHQEKKHHRFSSKNEAYSRLTSDNNKSLKATVHTYLESQSNSVYLGSLQVEPVPLPAGCGLLWKVVTSETGGAKSKEGGEQDTCAEQKSSGTSQDANTINTIPDGSSSFRPDVNISMDTESETEDGNKDDDDSFLDPEAVFQEAFSLSDENDLENCENDLITDFSKRTSSPINRSVSDEDNGYTSDGNIHHHAESMTEEETHQGLKLPGFSSNIEDYCEWLTSDENKSSTGTVDNVAESKSTNPVYLEPLQVEPIPMAPGSGFLWKVITSENIGKKPFKCDKCYYSCARPSYLQEHIKMAHTEYNRDDDEEFTSPEKNRPAFNTMHDSKSTYPFYATQTYTASQHGNMAMVVAYGAAAEEVTRDDRSRNERHSSRMDNSRTPSMTAGDHTWYPRNVCSTPSVEKPTPLTENHKTIQAAVKPFKCGQCGNRYKRRNDLKIHTMTHTGERPFKCELCDYSSTRSTALKCHKMTHTGEKPFKCDQCSYSSAVSRYLTWHKMTHSGEKPFKCDQCNYACTRRCNLTLHKVVHINEKQIYECDHCNYTASTYVRWKCHYRIHYVQKPQSSNGHKESLKNHSLFS